MEIIAAASRDRWGPLQVSNFLLGTTGLLPRLSTSLQLPLRRGLHLAASSLLVRTPNAHVTFWQQQFLAINNGIPHEIAT